MIDAQLKALLEYARSEGRICPTPLIWKRLWESLPGKDLTPGRWIPSSPLILGGWVFSNDFDKAQRFEEHLRYAAAHGALNEVEALVRGLTDRDWHWAENAPRKGGL